MIIATLALFSLQILGTLGTPFYLKVRGTMSASKMHKYSKKRILKDIILHFGMMAFITAHFVVILFAFLHSNTGVTQSLLFYVSLEVVLLAGAVYGSGMYITSVLFETTTKRYFYINKLIHGPISHGIMYGSYLAAFGNLANIFSQTNFSSSPFPLISYLFIGILGGYSVGISAISSGIVYLYSILSLTIGLIFTIYSFDLANPFFLHFVGFFISSFVVSLSFALLTKRKTKKIVWYMPINFTKIKVF